MTITAEAPAGLGDAGTRLWEAMIAAVAPDWSLDERDLLVLEQAARQTDLIGLLEASIEADGVTVLGAAGQERLNAAVPALNVARSVLARLLAQVEIAPPRAQTGHLNGRQRTNQRRRDLRSVGGSA